MDSEQEEFLAFQTQKVQMGKNMTYEKKKKQTQQNGYIYVWILCYSWDSIFTLK